jgi:outer membrane protein insertion porin family
VYEFPGALQFPYTRLLEAAQYQEQEPYTAGEVAAATSGLVAFFRQEGYFQAQVHALAQINAPDGLVNVSFATVMGPRARFGKVTLNGANAAETARLNAELGSWMARLRRSAILAGKPYSFPTLQNATRALQATLDHSGRMGAQVQLSGAHYDRRTNRADIRFMVEPGPRVKVRVTGAHLWPWTRHGLIPIYSESRVSADLIQEGEENLANHFAANGYFSWHLEAPGDGAVLAVAHGGAEKERAHRRADRHVFQLLLRP